MGLIADDQIPCCDLQFCLDVLIASQFIQTDNTQIAFQEHIARDCRLKAVIGQYIKAQSEFVEKLILPLFRQIAGRYDQAPLQCATDNQFLDKQPCHDGLTCTGIICQNVAQRQAW